MSYGIQWVSFGILAPIGLGYFVYAELRARRREKQQEAPPVTDAPPVSDAPPPPKTVEEKLADRYGRRR